MLLTPSTLISLLLFAGALLLITRRYWRWGVAGIGTATALYIALGSGWTATWLLGRLEYQHAAAQSDAASASATAIVVLTGFAQIESGVPITGQLNRASAVRVLEAARLLAQRPLPVYISGYDNMPGLLDRALRSVAGPTTSVQVDSLALSTYDSAVNLKPDLQSRPFYLVTSAGHMPRSLAVFRSLGMQPIPAPTDFLTRREWRNADWMPSASHLEMSDLAIHEYVGILWYRLRGRL